MKLAVSNIAWDDAEQAAVLSLLARHDVAGIEIAPTKVWRDWDGASAESAAQLRCSLEVAGFVAPSMQSVLFARADLHVFGSDASRQALIAHLREVASMAGALGAYAVVFGSPRNRDRSGLDDATAMGQAREVFGSVADDFAKSEACLCLEANPAQYNCNFLTRWTEAAELTARINHPGIGLHLDTACTYLAGDDPAEAARQCGSSIRHFHISEPQLGGFENPAIDHTRVGAALRAAGYGGWISIEMRRQDNPIDSIDTAVKLARACYG